MKKTHSNPLQLRKDKNRSLVIQFIKNQVKKGTKKSITELKDEYYEERLFFEALRYVTTTKKALCKALNINIDNSCRHKRKFEQLGSLVQSIDDVICPYTGCLANALSTDPLEFEKLQSTNQLKLF